MTHLEVNDLRVSIGRSGPDVVSEVSFSLNSGEVLGLVGESGSGKTTVGLALLGYARRGLAIVHGEVLLAGVDLLSLPPHELRGIRGRMVAYVPQDPSAALNPTLRVGTQLKEILKRHGKSIGNVEGRLADVLAETSLAASVFHRYPHELSGGQQQRVTLAMAFSCRPLLIVLDEPTTGLDVTIQRHVLESVRSLCTAYGVAAVYVSHDLAVVDALATKVAVMYGGRIVEYGATPSVLGNPVHPYTRGLLAAVPSWKRAEILHGIKGSPPRPGRRPPGCAFSPRCPYSIDRCIAASPEPNLVDGRLVRCHRADEIESREREQKTVAQVSPATDDGLIPAVLSVRDLEANYGPTRVLSEVNLELSAESCLAVVGESGSGKTTLARCIAGLHSNWSGEVRLESEALALSARKRPKDALRRIQYVFQNPYTSLNPRKTIGQIVSQPLENFFDLPFLERSERVFGALKSVSLGTDFASRFPDQLSGGERQRVAIARALVVGPDILICDEVTSALDVSVQAVIVELLRTLQKERRLAMIFITHNLALVRSIAQTVLVLRDGQIIEVGEVEDILERPKSIYTAQLMRDVPELREEHSVTEV
jgi:peptide/nickel transport system ATP-binding protein